MFFSCFIIVASSGAKIFQQMENCNFPRVFLHFFIMFFSCFIIFASSGAKIFQKIENCNFPRVFSLFYHFFIRFFHFSIIFASSGAKIFQKIENCNFPRVFLIVYHFLSLFYHFCFQWCMFFPKNRKLQFSSRCFHFLIIFLSFLNHFFYHFSRFLLPVVQKFSKK